MTKAKRTPEAVPEAGALRVEYVPLADVVPANANPKQHDLEGLRSSMVRFGFGDPMALDERTGRLLEGHGRREALLAMLAEGAEPPRNVRSEGGAWLVPVVRGFRTFDDAEAEAYLIAHNRLVERGGWDDKALLASLRRIEKAGGPGLAGLGWSQENVDALALLAHPAEPVADLSGEWDGMPEFKQDDLTSHQRIVVNFARPEDVEAFALLINQRLTSKTRSIWFPAAEIGHMADKAFTADAPPA